MRFATWNVNSIRTRQPRVIDWIDQHQPDILCLQETKCTDAVFMSPEIAGAYQARGYEVAHHGVDHWNGVAILSRVGLAGIRRGFGGINRGRFDEARLISAHCAEIEVWSVYAPNGRSLDDSHYLYKLVWLERLRATIEPKTPTIVMGDFNVAPTDADIYDPARWKRRTHASPPERAAIDALVDLGLVDVTRVFHPEPGVFTWWSYRPGQFEKNRGLRLDLALCSDPVSRRVTGVHIDTAERGAVKPSDHAPVIVTLDD